MRARKKSYRRINRRAPSQLNDDDTSVTWGVLTSVESDSRTHAAVVG